MPRLLRAKAYHGIEPDGLVEILNGAVGLAHASVGQAPVVEGIGAIRVDPDGLVEVLNGAVGLAHASVGQAPVDEGQDVIRVDPDGLVQVLNGAVVLALASVGGAPACVGVSKILLRLVVRLDYRRATGDGDIGIGGGALLLIEGLGGRCAAEARNVDQHK